VGVVAKVAEGSHSLCVTAKIIIIHTHNREEKFALMKVPMAEANLEGAHSLKEPFFGIKMSFF